MCPACGDHNYAKNVACRRCGQVKPEADGAGGVPHIFGSGGSGPPPTMRPGDWICPNCGDHNYARNICCRRCQTQKPEGAGGHFGSGGSGPAPQMRPGDWICPNCSDHNYAKNAICRRCGTPKQEGDGAGGGADLGVQRQQQQFGGGGGGQFAPKPGDWYCPSCSDLNFARNVACRRCGTPKPDMGAGVPAGGAAGGCVATGFAMHNGKTMKPGDWICPNCGDLNFARNTNCRRCGTAKPNFDSGFPVRGRSRSPVRV